MQAKQIVVLLISFIVIFTGVVVAQDDYVRTGFEAYDVPIDARSIAMGESFVALAGNRSAIMYNPAGLGAVRGAQAQYAVRRLDWVDYLGGAKYHQIDGTVQTPYVNLGFTYNRFVMPDIIESTPSNPEGIGKADFFNYLIAVGFGKRIGDNWDVGISLKTYDVGLNRISGIVSEIKTSRPFLIDLGVIYNSQICPELVTVTQSFSVGASLQNLGGKLVSTSDDLVTEIRNANRTYETSLPQYIGIGFTYCLAVNGQTEESLRPLSVLTSAEYRTFTNGHDSQSGQKDFWGFGIELKAVEILSVRLSGFVQPHSSIYGLKGRPALRYGMGIALPFSKLGAELPITLQFDYAGIPPQIGNGYIGERQTRTMRAYSLSITYENELF